MGSIDKFGRPLWSKKDGSEAAAGLRGPKGEGFVLDVNGNYLVSQKRIKELEDPEDDRDAVNKRWIEWRMKPIDGIISKLKNFGVDSEGFLVVSLKRIRQLEDPIDGSDAVNKRWVEERMKPIDEKIKIFDQDKQATLNLFFQANDIGQKAFEKASAVESTLRGLSNRLTALETTQYNIEP